MKRKRLRNGRGRRRGGKPQNLTCFLVTEAGELLPASEMQFYHFITGIPLHPQGQLPHVAVSPLALSPIASPAMSPAMSPVATSPATPQATSLLSLSSQVSHTKNIQNPLLNQTYFHSKVARNVFGYSKPKNKEERNKDVRDIIYERILKFRAGAFTYSGWQNLMEDRDEINKCNNRFVHGI